MRTKQSAMVRRMVLSTVIIASAAVVGCGSMQEPVPLQDARTAYMQAEKEADIAKYAPVRLREAQQSLQRAERTWKDEADVQEVQHLADLTTQRVEIARALAQQKAAEAAVEQLGDERTKLQREASEREAQRAKQQAAQAMAQTKKLEKELAALKAKPTERGLVLTLGDVLFNTGQASLNTGALRSMYPLITFLKENPSRGVSIEGHTDSVGSESSNLDLSQRRADAVLNFLRQNGVSSSNITSRGYGEGSPIASNDTSAGRQQNRRVEIIIQN